MRIFKRLAALIACAAISVFSFSGCSLFPPSGDADKPHTCKAGVGYESDGNVHWQICRTCGKKINVTPHYKATDNHEDGWVCVCKYVHRHEYQEEYTAPTCTLTGQTDYVCKCGYKNYKMTKTHEALGHDLNTEVYHEATCLEGDYYTSDCKRCGYVARRGGTVAKLEHSFVTFTDKDAATCTKNATQTAHCSLCGIDYEIEKQNTMLGHSFTGYVSQDDATCTEDGTLKAKCDRCDAVDVKTDVGSKKPHEYSEEWTYDGKFSTEHHHKCKNCNAVTDRENHKTEQCKCTVCGFTYDYSRQVGYKKINGASTYYASANDYFTDEMIVIQEEYQRGQYDFVEVTRIGSFYGCESIKQFRMPDTIREISSSAFSNCTNLQSIYLSKNLETLGANAFSVCTSLKEIVLPAKLTGIGNMAFSNCSKLEKIFFEGDEAQWNAATAGNSYTYNYGTLYTYKKVKPTTAGNYWRYDEHGKPEIWVY